MAKRTRKGRKSSYSADRPIRSDIEDLLGRASFAKNLAEDIRSWEGHDSLVIGLYGGWGAGKTSLKNLLCAQLKKGRAPMAVMEFNPWQFSGTGHIASSFFTELGIALRGVDVASASEARGKKLDLYAKRILIGGSATEAIGAVLAILGIPGSRLVTLAGGQLKKMADVTKEGGDALEGEGAKRSMSELKRDLSESLRDVDRPLLVVIDDIDRLTTDEIREVLQLVKANADFPNLIYLLLCERSIVAGALDGISGSRGAEFLEKIVQVGYDVPQVSRRSLEKVLFHGLDERLELPGVSKRWEDERWRELYISGLSVYFKSLRHVYRFLGSFDFHVRQFHRGEHFEVNPIDLIALETLRVFEPTLYERLAGSKRILTRNEGFLGFGDEKQNVIDAAVTQLLSGLPEGRLISVKHLLKSVFPPIQSAYSGRLDVVRDQPSWLRLARVCHPDLFDKYFTLSIGEDDISQAELDRLVGYAGDREKFAAECETLAYRGLLETAFERLDAYKEEIPLDSLPALIRALCDISDAVLKANANRTPFSSLDTVSSAARLVYFGLLGEADAGKRFDVLSAAFSDSEGIFLPIRLVSMLGAGDQEDGQVHDTIIREPELARLRDICLEKIRILAGTGRLRSHGHSIAIFHQWRAWAPEEAKTWMAQDCVTPEAAAWLLSALISSVTSGSRTRYYLNLSNVAKYYDIKTLEKLVDGIALDALPEIQRTAVKEFRRALQRKAEGKPEVDGSSVLHEED